MKYAQLVFSPTGGTEKAAAAITKEWGQEIGRASCRERV